MRERACVCALSFRFLIIVRWSFMLADENEVAVVYMGPHEYLSPALKPNAFRNWSPPTVTSVVTERGGQRKESKIR